MAAVVERTLAPVRFAREAIASVIGEVEPLMRAHWGEVGHYRDVPLDPDFRRYEVAEREGVLRIYTVRAEQLAGYAIYLLGTALHYRDVITAQQATLFLHPEHRKGHRGRDFIDWTERELKAEGVQIIIQHVKAKHDAEHHGAFCRMLERRGYELQDYLLTKKL